MGRWYRRPKRLNLKPLVRHSNCEFVFDPFGISREELSGFQSSFACVVAPQRLFLGAEPIPRHEQVLIVPEGIGAVPPSERLIATDAEGRVVLMNRVAEKLTGWPLDEARGKPLVEVFRIVNEETRRAVENPVDKVRRLNTVVGLAILYNYRIGKQRYILVSSLTPTAEVGAVNLWKRKSDKWARWAMGKMLSGKRRFPQLGKSKAVPSGGWGRSLRALPGHQKGHGQNYAIQFFAAFLYSRFSLWPSPE